MVSHFLSKQTAGLYKQAFVDCFVRHAQTLAARYLAIPPFLLTSRLTVIEWSVPEGLTLRQTHEIPLGFIKRLHAGQSHIAGGNDSSAWSLNHE
jgi:hypothetical protein